MNKKMQIIYYSYSGNTEKIAACIQQQTATALCPIEPIEAYPTDYNQTVNRVLKEMNTKSYPAIQPVAANLSEAELIFLGSPIWCGTIAHPLRTFLTSNDLTSKKIVPFIAHGGSGSALAVQDIKTLAPGATLLKEITINRENLNQTDQIIEDYLANLDE